MQGPARLAGTTPLITGDKSQSKSIAERMLLNLKLTLKAQLHAEGWKDIDLKDFRVTSYVLEGFVHLVVTHTPLGLPGVLLGGAEDGAVFPINTAAPPLTVGMISSTDAEDYLGCPCYSCNDAQLSPVEGEEEWTHWMLTGLTRSPDEGWRWAYTSATTYGVNRQEQRAHDAGVVHSPCTLCRMSSEMVKASPFALPTRITAGDAQLHFTGEPHTDIGCTGCMAGLPMDLPW